MIVIPTHGEHNRGSERLSLKESQNSGGSWYVRGGMDKKARRGSPCPLADRHTQDLGTRDPKPHRKVAGWGWSQASWAGGIFPKVTVRPGEPGLVQRPLIWGEKGVF